MTKTLINVTLSSNPLRKDQIGGSHMSGRYLNKDVAPKGIL